MGLSELRDGFDFAENTLRQRLSGNAGAGRAADKVLGIDLIELGKISHICEEAGGLDDFGHVASGSGEDGGNVLAALLGLSVDGVTGRSAGRRIDGDLAGGKYKAVRDDRLRLRADRGGGGFGGNYFHDNIPP